MINYRSGDFIDDPSIKRLCNGTTRDGSPCTNSPMAGMTVCWVHGGKNPLTQANAKRRLATMIEPALAVLNEAMAKADWPVAVRAALGLLDRAGLGPSATLNVVDESRPDLETMTEEALEKRAATVLTMMKERRAAAAQTAREIEARRIMELAARASEKSQLDELERMNDGDSDDKSSVH
jgi:uncharacterized lipoprotein NlpE involved in copper resistance